jgi:hypothetical protein
VGNRWIARNLAMGHSGSVSRSVSDGKANREMLKAAKELDNMLIRLL